ncbi:hypothetical protein [Bdellovibrio reynosensis]|uniref:Uncharacterized protein n=1 Tax=Bdellovibrio reynosensis TaxID=2835041 RepID=A0ABY4CCI4_9BACT|nr:hypothetical protein [Bdellovibrio reynosensis]UOF02553.1 hypothetical protein MNR06_06255 [Bdellovibrio reynosensis]
MKKLIIAALIMANPALVYAENRPNPPAKNSDVYDISDYDSFNPYFSKEELRIIRELALQEPQYKSSEDHDKKIVVVTETEDSLGPVTVFGFSEKEVLAMDNDPQGAACSDKHNQGDISNRWCHAYFVKLVDTYLRKQGLNKNLSALLAASIFVPKEFLYDKNPSASDLVIAEYEVFNRFGTKQNTRLTVSLFGDKTVFLTFQKRF